jgi:ABC-type molybdate transport system permease subunit
LLLLLLQPTVLPLQLMLLFSQRGSIGRPWWSSLPLLLLVEPKLLLLLLLLGLSVQNRKRDHPC